MHDPRAPLSPSKTTRDEKRQERKRAQIGVNCGENGACNDKPRRQALLRTICRNERATDLLTALTTFISPDALARCNAALQCHRNPSFSRRMSITAPPYDLASAWRVGRDGAAMTAASSPAAAAAAAGSRGGSRPQRPGPAESRKSAAGGSASVGGADRRVGSGGGAALSHPGSRAVTQSRGTCWAGQWCGGSARGQVFALRDTRGSSRDS